MINFDDIPLIETKYNFFKNTFFPSAIIEWNKLHPTIFDHCMLFYFEKQKPQIYYTHHEVFKPLQTQRN